MSDQNKATSQARVIAYWVTTGLICLAMGAGGVVDVTKADQVIETIEHLGYPHYFIVMLGVAKLLSVAALLAPKLPTLKEWAYAGIVFDLIAAAVSHLAVGDPITEAVPPIGLLVVTAASYLLRPPGRRLPASS